MRHVEDVQHQLQRVPVQGVEELGEPRVCLIAPGISAAVAAHDPAPLLAQARPTGYELGETVVVGGWRGHWFSRGVERHERDVAPRDRTAGYVHCVVRPEA